MPYAEGRVYYDADSHVMEREGWLTEYAEPSVRELLRSFGADKVQRARTAETDIRQRYEDQDRRASAEQTLMTMKGWESFGGTDAGERSRALDLLGFSAQLVFSTVASEQFWYYDHPELMYGGSRALNRAIVDWCSVDRRLLPVGFVPLADPERSVAELEAAIELGCDGVIVPSVAPPEFSPAHPAYDRFWATLQDADMPFFLHVCTGGALVPDAYRNNGRTPPADFLGGGENIRSKDYMGMHVPPQTFLTMLVLDGVFDRFPTLRCGCIEQGGLWVAPWMKQLDISQMAFGRTEPDLRALSMRPSDFVRRQVKFTAFFVEPLDWLIEQAGPDLFMFGTDFPHTEGGTDPLGAAEKFLAGVDETVKDRFFAGNFAELMGSRMAKVRQ
ncbi:amidohydrolase family protein [Micromonospora sp. NPDC023888]|uniref:amidohydrolase family protein n=1 Tax=Micromonospora sp. NPDC023888 TaxID=3155607 RepID=UPI0033F5A3E3